MLLEKLRCTELLLCHVAALFDKYRGAGLLQHLTGRPGCPTALFDHSWAVSWVNHAVFI